HFNSPSPTPPFGCSWRSNCNLRIISCIFTHMNVVRCALLRKPIATLWPIVATLILSAVAKDVHAQAPHWARRAGGGTVDEATSISMDAEGNSYTTGYFTGTATFGTQVLSSS